MDSSPSPHCCVYSKCFQLDIHESRHTLLDLVALIQTAGLYLSIWQEFFWTSQYGYPHGYIFYHSSRILYLQDSSVHGHYNILPEMN